MSERFRVRAQRRALRAAQRLFVPPVPVDQRLEDLIEVGRHTFYPGRPGIVHFGTYSVRLVIGAFCAISDGVEFILDGDHRVDWVTTFPIRVVFGLPGAGTDGHPTTRGDITIGNDVWIHAARPSSRG